MQNGFRSFIGSEEGSCCTQRRDSVWADLDLKQMLRLHDGTVAITTLPIPWYKPRKSDRFTVFLDASV